jgi:hypothetical protein
MEVEILVLVVKVEEKVVPLEEVPALEENNCFQKYWWGKRLANHQSLLYNLLV